MASGLLVQLADPTAVTGSIAMTKVQRYIRHIFAPAVGELWTNEDLLARIGKHLQTVDQPHDAKESLLKLVRLF